MRTEILPANEMPAMTGEHMRRAICAMFEAWQDGDRETIERHLAEDFAFTSPHDDGIDRAAYFDRRWPDHKALDTMTVERIVIDGASAYVTYTARNMSGRASRNTAYVTFNGGKIASIETYLGPEYKDGHMLPAEPRPASQAH